MPCPRPRIAVRGRFPVAYYPKAYADWKIAAAKALKRALLPNHLPYDIPVALAVDFFVKRPKTSKLRAPQPDIDNYLKSILDAMTAAEVWADDSLVVTATARKRWADEDSISIYVAPELL